MENKDKDQMEHRNSDGTFKKGYKPKSTFADRPQDRHNGSWHKEDTPRYWIEKFTSMSEQELKDYYDDEKNPLFRRRMAKYIKDGDWSVLKDMIEQVYGKMPVMEIKVEADEETTEETSKFIRGFCLP